MATARARTLSRSYAVVLQHRHVDHKTLVDHERGGREAPKWLTQAWGEIGLAGDEPEPTRAVWKLIPPSEPEPSTKLNTF